MTRDVRLHPVAGVDEIAEIPPDAALVTAGWVRRHLVEATRAQESVDLYTSMGYEVTVRKLTRADLGPRCGACAPLVCGSCVLIYTRKEEHAGGCDTMPSG